jgi:2-polyprenyl-3-methyl-5-hydroxy-6-metoxy-1,4-benzoquinol methylase
MAARTTSLGSRCRSNPTQGDFELSASTVRYFGVEKAASEPSRLRRWAYRLLGEIHISGRIRLYHVIREIGALGLPEAGVKFLDAGTARGDVALHFARMRPQWRVRGIDLDPGRVKRCQSAAKALTLTNARFECGNLLTLRESETYDLVTCSDVLEHIEDDQCAVANLARSLNPGGRLLLTFPADPSRRHLRLLHWLERRRGGVPSGVVGHVRQGYDQAGAAELVESAGLEVAKVRWTYGFFGTLAHDLFFVFGDSEVNPVAFVLALPALLTLSFIEGRTIAKSGSALLVVARKPV